MKTTRQYLAEVKRRLEISSDYALAQRLALSKQAASALMKGTAVMSTTTAAKIAEILELDPLKVIADAELERGSSPEIWQRIRDAAVIAGAAIGAAALYAALGGFNNNEFAAALAALSLPIGDATVIHIAAFAGAGVLTLIAAIALALRPPAGSCGGLKRCAL